MVTSSKPGLKWQVQLSPNEVQFAAIEGVRRQCLALQKVRTDAHGCAVDEGWQRHIEGALYECALAKMLDIHWDAALGNLKQDVGFYQVRGSNRSNASLILHPKDGDSEIFVLVIGINGAYQAKGWIWGHDGKQDEFWCDPTRKNRPAYFVPQSRLKPMRELPTKPF